MYVSVSVNKTWKRTLEADLSVTVFVGFCEEFGDVFFRDGDIQMFDQLANFLLRDETIFVGIDGFENLFWKEIHVELLYE